MKTNLICGIFLLCAGLLLSNCSTNSSAQSQDETVKDERYEHVIPGDGTQSCSPYFFVKSNDPSKSWMPLNSTKVDVQITGAIANVRVEQIYVNKSKQKLDAIYIFPGSTRAAVYGMDMTVGKRVIHAKVMQKEKARENFEQAKKEGKSATLLEQDRPNVFKTEVANILPGETIKVKLFYTELLEYRDKEYEFVYPTAVGPRYSTTNEEYVTRSIEQLESRHKPKFDIGVVIDGAIPVQTVESSTHQIKINRESNTTTKIALSNPAEAQLDKDFILHYGLQGGQVESGLTLYEHNDEKFFLFMMQPPKSVTDAEILPREYIFIVDVSGSMEGYPLEVSKTILKKLISNLRATDRFNVLLFESSNSMLSNSSLPATKANIQKAIQVIDRQSGSGGTELYPALKKAFDYKDPALANYARTFIIATDGFVSVESRAIRLISENINKANFFPLGIGNGVNRYLIEGMAWAGASEPFIIENQTVAEKTGDHFIKTISQPLLTDIQIDWDKFEVYDIYPQQVPNVFTERPVIVFGKYKGDAKGTISIKGKAANGNFNRTIQVSEATRSTNEALRYLWARNKIKYLSDYPDRFKDDEYISEYDDNHLSTDRIDEITQLGLKYNLLTRFTSFLAIDNIQESIKGRDVAMDSPDFQEAPVQINALHFTPPVIVEEEPDETTKVFEHVESPPAFPGGEKALTQFIYDNLTYPDSAKEQGIQGIVHLKFVIDATGQVKDIKIMRSLDPACDAEAVRIILLMPKWIPGKSGGKAVDTSFNLPIRFRLAT